VALTAIEYRSLDAPILPSRPVSADATPTSGSKETPAHDIESLLAAPHPHFDRINGGTPRPTANTRTGDEGVGGLLNFYRGGIGLQPDTGKYQPSRAPQQGIVENKDSEGFIESGTPKIMEGSASGSQSNWHLEYFLPLTILCQFYFLRDMHILH
jgi:hypothetical protein